MSISQIPQKSNSISVFMREYGLVALLFIGFCLISFALGRMSAFAEYAVPKEAITITQSR